jgi:hypothetical protein
MGIMDTVDLVQEALSSKGFDGLMNIDGDCQCRSCDINPECLKPDCTAAFEHPCLCGNHDFHMHPEPAHA